MKKNRGCMKKYSEILVLIYLVFLTYCILFKGSYSYLKACIAAYNNGEILQKSMNLQLMASISSALSNWKNPWLLMNLLVNIALFLPWGMFLGKKYQQSGCRIAVAGMLLSLGYELIQYVTGFGAFDVDDIVLNSAGTLAGYGLMHFYNSQRRRNPPGVFFYLMIQTVVNLTYVLCSTSFHYIFFMGWTISKAAGLIVAVCLGGSMWYHRLFLGENGKFTKALPIELSGRKDLCLWFLETCLQIIIMGWMVDNWLPNSLVGCIWAIVLWTVVLLLWYWLGRAEKCFGKNK